MDRAKLLARKVELTDHCNALLAANPTGISEDQQAEIDAALAEIETIDANVKRLDALAKAESSLERPQPRKASAANPDVKVGKERAEDDPKAGFKTPREFMQMVMDAGRGRRPDARLNALRVGMTAGSDEQGEYSDAYGGFLVPPAFRPEMLMVDSEPDPIVGRTRAIPMASPTVPIPARTDKNHATSVSGGLKVGRKSETTAAATSRMATELVTLRANSLFGAAFATEEVLADSPISFAALLQAGFTDEFRANHIKECLSGTGVGEYEGINNSPALVTVAKESGQVADTITYTNVLSMRSRCWGYGNAVWMANHDCLPQLAKMSITVGVGGAPIYHFSATEDVPDMLLGRPIFYSEFCETLGDAGDIVCVNWSQYLEGSLQDMQGAESIHVRFLEHERCFKFWTRNDGRGWWRSALTPNKSAATLSPFVRLAARA